MVLDETNEATTKRVKCDGKFRDIELCGLPVSLVQDILPAETEGCGITRLGESNKTLSGRVSQVDEAVMGNTVSDTDRRDGTTRRLKGVRTQVCLRHSRGENRWEEEREHRYSGGVGLSKWNFGGF